MHGEKEHAVKFFGIHFVFKKKDIFPYTREKKI